MSGKILSFASLISRSDRPRVRCQDWSPQELAELYRVRDRLADGGFSVAVEAGLTDEGEPWAAFTQGTTGEAFIHIARLENVVVVANLLTGAVYRGADFRAITDQMLDDVPLVRSRRASGDAKVVMHPHSVFMAFVAAALVLGELVRSSEPAHAQDADKKAAPADAKALFPHIFDRIVARDYGTLGQAGSAAAVVALISAAAGAVLLAEQGEGVGPLAAASTPQTVDAMHLSQNSETAAVQTEEPVTRSFAGIALDAEHSSGSAGAAGGGRIELPRAADVEVAVVRERPIEPEGHQEFAADSRAGTLLPAQIISKRGVSSLPAADTLPSHAAEKGNGSGTASISTAPEANHDIGGISPRELATIQQSVLTPTMLAIVTDFAGPGLRFVAVDGSVTIVGETRSSNSVTQPSSAGTMVAAQEEWLVHIDRSDDEPAVLNDGTHDVVALGTHDVTVFNFKFGEDYLLVDKSIERTDWIKTVDIDDNDVRIVSVNGAVISLIDTHGLIA